MTENLSFFEGEQSSNMPETEYVDLLAQPTWQEFCDDAKRAEFDVSDYNPNDDEDCMKVSLRASDLCEQIGPEHIGMRATVTGMGYIIRSETSAAPASEPFFINTNTASFHGVNICFFEGKWQTMLEIYCSEHTDEVPHGMYNIPPDAHHLMTLNIDVIDDDDDDDDVEDDDSDLAVVKNLQEDYQSAQAFVYSSDFASADPQSQRMLLGDICTSANSEMPYELRDRDIVIACTRYYTAYDDMHYTTHHDPQPGFDLRDFLTDLSDTSPDDRHALNGIVADFEYPEMKMLSPDHPISAGALDLNDGAYCMVLRSERERATHYILPQTITDIY